MHSDCKSEPVNIVDSEGYIHSPNYPNEYPPDRLCVWRLGVDDSFGFFHTLSFES